MARHYERTTAERIFENILFLEEVFGDKADADIPDVGPTVRIKRGPSQTIGFNVDEQYARAPVGPPEGDSSMTCKGLGTAAGKLAHVF